VPHTPLAQQQLRQQQQQEEAQAGSSPSTPYAEALDRMAFSPPSLAQEQDRLWWQALQQAQEMSSAASTSGLATSSLVLTTQAGLPIRAAAGPSGGPGSLNVGLSYSTADLTSYRWKELSAPAPQQAAWMNRVEIMKLAHANGVYNASQM
jgi:hypothetical protein